MSEISLDDLKDLVREYFRARDEFDACSIKERQRMGKAAATLDYYESALRDATKPATRPPGNLRE